MRARSASHTLAVLLAAGVLFACGACASGHAPDVPESIGEAQAGRQSPASAGEEPAAPQQYARYLDPLHYTLGRDSWSSAQDIEPDALVTFFFSLPLVGEVAIPADLPRDKEHGNPLIPREMLERAVQERFAFEVPAEHIRASKYYDPGEEAYWTGGIGSTADLELAGDALEDGVLTLDYTGVIDDGSTYRSSWKGRAVIRLHDDGSYAYVSLGVRDYVEEYR